MLPRNGRTSYSPDERAIGGGGSAGALGEGDQGRSLPAGQRENNEKSRKP